MLNQFGLNSMKDTKEFVAALDTLKQQVPLGARYFHYKNPNQFYTIVAHGIIEATGEPAISYQAEYDDKIIWIRPVSVFLATIEHDGRQMSRFTHVNS